MTTLQRTSIWLSSILFLIAGDVVLLSLLAQRGLSPFALFLIGAGIPGLFFMGANMIVPVRCVGCRLHLGFPRRISEMLRGSGTTPRCATCRSHRL